MRAVVLLLVLVGLCTAALGDGSGLPDLEVKVSSHSGKESPRYWRGPDGSVHKDNEDARSEARFYPDKVEVVSSSLRILPRKKQGGDERHKRSAPGESQAADFWRRPREYRFVTRDRGPVAIGSSSSLDRSARLVDPLRASSSQYYPQRRSYYDDDQYYNNRRSSPPQRRIIYYATLPEVVRRPGEWTPPRPIYNPPTPYPPVRDNEIRVSSGLIDTVRVHSGIIDVSDSKPKPLDQASSPQDLSIPKFTIIDAEPPYNKPGYERDRYDYYRYDAPNRYNNNYDKYNDYRNFVEPPSPPPYRPPYYEPLPSAYSHQRFPPSVHHEPLPITVHRPQSLPPLGDDRYRPLDVRPLDPMQFSTQAPPLSSSTTTHSPSSSSTSPETTLTSFERTFKY